MAPALPVYTREEIKTMYPELFPERIEAESGGTSTSGGASGPPGLSLDNCKLYSLVQHQCTYDGNKCVCVPFKRVFARCLDRGFNARREVVGYKLTPAHQSMMLRNDISQRNGDEPVYRNVEITDWMDNDYAGRGKGDADVSDDLLKEFLRADKVFQRKVKEYYARSSKQ